MMLRTLWQLWLCAAFGVWLCLAAAPTLAQTSPSPETEPLAESQTPSDTIRQTIADTIAPEPSPTAALESLIQALEDPQVRDRLVQALKDDLADAPPTTNGNQEAANPTLDLESEVSDTATIPQDQPTQPAPPPSTITLILSEIRAALAGLLEFAVDAVDVDRLIGWIDIQASSHEFAEFWADFLTSLALTLGTAAGGFWLVWLAILRPWRRLTQAARADLGRRKWPIGIRLVVLEVLPVATFALVSAGLVTILPFPLRTDLTAIAVLAMIGSALLLNTLARMVFRPRASSLRLLPLGDEAAQSLHARIRFLIFWSLLGQAWFYNIPDLRVPSGVFEGLERLWGLVILGVVLQTLVRYRERVTNVIRSEESRLALFRRFVAQIWFIVAVLYSISAYLVWALEVYQGFDLMIRGSLLSLLILFAIQPISLFLQRTLNSAESADLRGAAAVLQARFSRYTALAHFLGTTALYFGAALAIAFAWDLQPLAWFDAMISGSTADTISDIAFVAFVCWAVWEGFDLWLSIYLDAVDDTGGRVERSARVLTLLPLLRTLVVVTLAIVFLVATLTSIGLDVAPLLATAGVVGIAVGFGAQKLVQDVITGLFMLFQNTVSVGDVVEVAGYSGTVERITVRTLELRDLEGAIHTIPFSAVSTITNKTRDFAFAMFDIGVAYKENADEVMEVLRQLGSEFETDPLHGPDLLASLEMFGVQDLGDSAVVIRCRFRVRPLTQWAIRRAFLARVKARFDALGIEIPFPQRTLHYAAPPAAPPASSPAPTSPAPAPAPSRAAPDDAPTSPSKTEEPAIVPTPPKDKP